MQDLQQYIDYAKTAWDSMGNERYIFVVIFIAMIGYSLQAFFYNQGETKRTQAFIAENPNAVSVLLKTGGTFITSHKMHLDGIEGHEVYAQTIRGKRYFWVKPGEYVIEASYEKTRPGFFYRSVTTTYGPAKLGIKVEAGKSYALSFNKKQGFEFSEI